MNLKELLNKRITQKYSFMGESVTISKLTVAEINLIRTMAKEEEAKGDANDADGLRVLKEVVKIGLDGGKDLADEDFNNLPMDELNKLSTAIMKFSGLDNSEKAGAPGKS